jgi:quercetin dioxygenase-like cupin family protein
MSIKIGNNPAIDLGCGDEIIVLPGTVHEVISNETTSFLTRVHSVNCHGDRDKYMRKKGIWVQALTCKNWQKKIGNKKGS